MHLNGLDSVNILSESIPVYIITYIKWMLTFDTDMITA